jgi:hypothetical protein
MRTKQGERRVEKEDGGGGEAAKGAAQISGVP